MTEGEQKALDSAAQRMTLDLNQLNQNWANPAGIIESGVTNLLAAKGLLNFDLPLSVDSRFDILRKISEALGAAAKSMGFDTFIEFTENPEEVKARLKKLNDQLFIAGG